MERYLSIKEAVEYTSKSESTIKRLVKRLKDSGNGVYNGEKILAYVQLDNKVKKVFLLKDYLDQEFNLSSSRESVNESVKELHDERVISIFEKQLDVKDKQLEEKDRQIKELLERQRETNILLERANQRIDLIEKMFKMTNKPFEIGKVQDDIVEDVEESSVLSSDLVNEPYKEQVEFTTKVEVDKRPLKKFKEVVITEAMKEGSKINKDEQKKKNFLDWLNKMQEERK